MTTEETFVSNLENVLILAFQLPLVAHRIISVKVDLDRYTMELLIVSAHLHLTG